MALTKYTYSIAALLNGKVDPTTLTTEISGNATIGSQLSHIETAGDALDIWFIDALSAGSEAILNGIVSLHSGNPLPPLPIPTIQYAAIDKPAPVAADGKMFVLPNSFPGEVLILFTGASDKITTPTSRLGGTLFGIQQTGVGTSSFSCEFLDGLFLAGGNATWTGGSWGSHIYMELLAPASSVKAPAVVGQGNCNLVPTGLGFNVIVPAAGNGQYDLDTVVPVPASNAETNAQNGYWNYSEPWIGKGTVSAASVPGTGKYNLYDTTLELAHFAKLHAFTDTGCRDLTAPAIKPKWILPEWVIKVEAYNADPNKTFSVSWDLMAARRKTA